MGSKIGGEELPWALNNIANSIRFLVVATFLPFYFFVEQVKGA